MCEMVLNQFENVVLPLAENMSSTQPLRMGVIHGDANDTNILIDDEDSELVVGIVDFSDSIYTWRVCEISVSAAYAMLSKTDPLAAALQVIRGYCSEYALLDSEIQALPVLIACRLVCTCVLGAYAHSMDPSNAYLLATQQPGWNALEFFISTTGLEVAAQKVKEACCQS